MGNELLASKIVIEEEEPRIRNIVGVPTAITLAEGVAERGPVNTPTKLTSFEEYVKIFGGYTANAQDLPLAVNAFFENGGSQIYVNRIVHYTDITSAATKTSTKGTLTLDTSALGATQGTVVSTNAAPFVFTPGGTLVINTDGIGTEIAAFDAVAASVTSGNTETFDLTDGLTLTLKVDQGPVQTVTFNTGEFVSIVAATALEVAAVINAEATGLSATVSAGAVVLTSDKKGTGSYVQVTGGTANTGGVNRLNFSTTEVQGTGDVADIEAVTAAEIKSVVEADITNGSGVTVTEESGGEIRITSNATPGPSSSVQVDASSTLDTVVGFDNATHSGAAAGTQNTLQVDGKYDGAYTGDIDVEIASSSSGDADEFNFLVLEDGNIVEIFPNVSMTDTDTNYVEDVVNDDATGSNLVTVTDLDATLTSPDDRPANGTFSMSAGDDGLSGLADVDFVGSTASSTGLRAFDAINEAQILIVPGRATSVVHNAMLTYAETTRGGSMFCILDSPEGYSSSQIITYVRTTASLKESSEFGALYWPRLYVANPTSAVFGNASQVLAPPSGHIAGKCAANDTREGGVYEAPAGEDWGQLVGALDVETTEANDEAKRDLVYPELINPITNLEGQPILIDGARCLKSTSNFPTVGERRGVIFIEQSLKTGLNFSRFRKIKRKLLKRMERAARLFLIIETRKGAFASDIPAQAFFVDFSEALNTASTAFQRKTVGRIGLATAKPNEFVVLRISQDQRALEEELALAA